MMRPFLPGILLAAAVQLAPAQLVPSLPREALASRPLPADFEQFRGMLAGDFCLIKSANLIDNAYRITKLYRFVNGAWVQQPGTQLPANVWPVAGRGELLAVEVGTGPSQENRRMVYDLRTGEILWDNLPAFYRQDFTRNYYAKAIMGSVEVRDRLGNFLNFTVDSVMLPEIRIVGDEIVIVSPDQGIGKVERKSLLNGATLDTWLLPGGTGSLAGFHQGKVLLRGGSTGMRLLLPGQPEPIDVPLPTANANGQRVVSTPNTLGSVISITDHGGWIGNGSTSSLHFSLAGPQPVTCDMVADGWVWAANDGLMALDDWPNHLVVDASLTAPPVVTLGSAKGKEISGELKVPVLLDRPAPANLRVQLGTADGGSAASGSDYTPTSAWVEIPAGSSSGEFTVPLVKDQVVEINESVLVNVTGGEGVSVPAGTSIHAIIEASGVARAMVKDFVEPVSWNGPTQATGGDGLIYRSIEVIETPSVSRVNVIDPATNAILETVEMTSERPSYEAGSFYVNTVPLITATADGVRCLTRLNGVVTAWDLSSKRTLPAVEVRVSPPSEGALPGIVEFRAKELSPLPVPVSWDWSIVAMSDGRPGARPNPILQNTGSISVPGDGSMVAVGVTARTDRMTDRRTPIRLKVENNGVTTDIILVEPSSPRFTPTAGEEMTGDSSVVVPLGGSGDFKVIGDRLYLGQGNALDAQGKKRGCLQVFDAATGAYIETIRPPSTLTHAGFGYKIYGDDKELFIVAMEFPDESVKVTPKVIAKLRTIFVYSLATKQFRATLKSPFAEFGELVRFNDSYLAVCSASSIDVTRKGSNVPGGVQLFRRSDYKQVGQLKLSGNGVGTSMELSKEGVLYVGVPAISYLPPKMPKTLRMEWVGGVYMFDQLPKLKVAKYFMSPTGPKGGAGFGQHMHLEPGGDLLLSESAETVHRLDPLGQRPAVQEVLTQDLYPWLYYQESDGVRKDATPRLYDVATKLPLVELDGGLSGSVWSGGAIYEGAVFAGNASTPLGLQRVPLQFCGNFDLWKKYGGAATATVGDPSADGNGNGKPDIEDYIIAQTGALPGFDVSYDTSMGAAPKGMRFRSVGTLPPDAVMIIEYSYVGKPWKICGVKRGNSPIHDMRGWKEDASGWTPFSSAQVLENHVEFRVSFAHTQSVSFGQDELRVIVR